MARILLIDDDINLLQMVKLMLTRVGHDVETSSSGEEGIVLAAKNRPDLAIIDVMMPGLSGYDVVHKLREDPRTARIPIIILTARSQPMDKHMALEAGANAFLSKPVTAQELTERVDAVLKAGVDYRVHTGLLTEPAQRPPAPEEEAPSETKPSKPTSDRQPIGAEDAPRPESPSSREPVVTVMGLRGGTGSTTVAVNLAFHLASHGQRVCMVDLSTASGHTQLHLHLNPQHHWGELLTDDDPNAPRKVSKLLTRHQKSGIVLLGAPPIPTTHTLGEEAVQRMLRELGTAFSPVIVDAPGLNDATRAALLTSRSVVLVMTDDPPSVQSTSQLLVGLHNMGLEMGRVRVALNHVRPASDVPPETIQKALRRPLSAEIPFDREQVNAIRRGVPLVIHDPNKPFSQAIKQLARTLV